MEGSILFVLNTRMDIISCTWMLRVVHSHDVHNHPIDDLFLSISLGVEGVDLVRLVSNSD